MSHCLSKGRVTSWQPLARSTGARTPEGKAASSRNAYKGGWLAELRELSKLLRGHGYKLYDELRQKVKNLNALLLQNI